MGKGLKEEQKVENISKKLRNNIGKGKKLKENQRKRRRRKNKKSETMTNIK